MKARFRVCNYGPSTLSISSKTVAVYFSFAGTCFSTSPSYRFAFTRNNDKEWWSGAYNRGVRSEYVEVSTQYSAVSGMKRHRPAVVRSVRIRSPENYRAQHTRWIALGTVLHTRIRARTQEISLRACNLEISLSSTLCSWFRNMFLMSDEGSDGCGESTPELFERLVPSGNFGSFRFSEFSCPSWFPCTRHPNPLGPIVLSDLLNPS